MSKRSPKKRYHKSETPKAGISSDPLVSIKSVSTSNFNEIDQIFFGKDSEELTDKLINELEAKGWERESLLNFQKEGFRYNRSRNSLIERVTHQF